MTDDRLEKHFKEMEKKKKARLQQHAEDTATDSVKRDAQINYFKTIVIPALKRFIKQVESHVSTEDVGTEIPRLSYSIKANGFTCKVYIKDDKLYYDTQDKIGKIFIRPETPYHLIKEIDIYNSVVNEFIKFDESAND